MSIYSKKNPSTLDCKYNRKQNYKKTSIPIGECNICYSNVMKTKDNTVTCKNTTHIICAECKIKVRENNNICPMCRSHSVYINSLTYSLKLNTKEKKEAKNIKPKQKRRIRRSKVNKFFPGKSNIYKNTKKEYYWNHLDDGQLYMCSWSGSNGEYVSKMPYSHREYINLHREYINQYDNYIELQINFTGRSESVFLNIVDNLIYGEDLITLLDLSIEDLGFESQIDLIESLY
jgi:RNA polymerase subunit RPABC4/transcription elongation factor Spt4